MRKDMRCTQMLLGRAASVPPSAKTVNRAAPGRCGTTRCNVVCGTRAAEAFSKLCPIDLQPEAFANWRVAQTTAARSNVILIRSDIGATLAYHVLGECGSAQYMWECLTDAAEEFSWTAVGLEALRKLRD